MATPMALLPEILRKVSLLCDPPTTRDLRSTCKTVRKHITEKDVVLAEANWRLSERSVHSLARWAARKWHRDILWWCLTENGGEWMMRPERSNYILDRAIVKDDMEVIKFLLEAWPETVDVDEYGWDIGCSRAWMINADDGMPLKRATMLGNVAVVRLLLDCGAQLMDSQQFSALDLAVVYGQTEVLKFLVGRVGRANVGRWLNFEVALYNAVRHERIAVLEYLLKELRIVRCDTYELMMAAEKGSVEMVQLLLDAAVE
ncbi:hypothetical protein HDV00_012728 [Rhizophlyctis rosea]|nr:hypothetical protein HDV00_012728 [Rhizophlyctis rosea]